MAKNYSLHTPVSSGWNKRLIPNMGLCFYSPVTHEWKIRSSSLNSISRACMQTQWFIKSEQSTEINRTCNRKLWHCMSSFIVTLFCTEALPCPTSDLRKHWIEGIEIKILKSINVTSRKHSRADVSSKSWTGYMREIILSGAYSDHSLFFFS